MDHGGAFVNLIAGRARLVRGRFINVVDDDFRSFTHQRESACAADAATRAGDDGDAILEQAHEILRQKGYLIRAVVV
jgi:hypothetical protein